mmetsp:Transcript_24591/g.80381  ORF Transcript_24591/g.80381 Transcript_24591/m.80381 type:complete len:362 (+) Transcript_24591:2307-3392(+)
MPVPDGRLLFDVDHHLRVEGVVDWTLGLTLELHEHRHHALGVFDRLNHVHVRRRPSTVIELRYRHLVAVRHCVQQRRAGRGVCDDQACALATVAAAATAAELPQGAWDGDCARVAVPFLWRDPAQTERGGGGGGGGRSRGGRGRKEYPYRDSIRHCGLLLVHAQPQRRRWRPHIQGRRAPARYHRRQLRGCWCHHRGRALPSRAPKVRRAQLQTRRGGSVPRSAGFAPPHKGGGHPKRTRVARGSVRARGRDGGCSGALRALERGGGGPAREREPHALHPRARARGGRPRARQGARRPRRRPRRRAPPCERLRPRRRPRHPPRLHPRRRGRGGRPRARARLARGAPRLERPQPRQRGRPLR